MIEKKNRNLEILSDKQKMSWKKLQEKWKLALPTLQKIVKRTKVKYGEKL